MKQKFYKLHTLEQTLKIFAFMVLCLYLGMSKAQAQKVAIVGYNNDDGGSNLKDAFVFVALEDLTPGEVIYFTDEDWDDPTDTWAGGSVESLFAWTADATNGLDKGCVVAIVEGASSNTLDPIMVSGGCDPGTIQILDFGFSISASDPLYAFSSSEPTTSSATNILNGITTMHSVMAFFELSGQTQDPSNDHPTAVIVDGVWDSSAGFVQYTSSRSTTVTRADLEDASNYTFDIDNNYTIDVTFFDDIDLSGGLPITLLSFEAKRYGREVLLNWTTVLEKDNAGFEIEMSSNAQDFEVIGFVKGAGNSSEIKNYELLITNSQSGYYRLKQIDFDGGFEYSDLRFVEGVKIIRSLRIIPNPTNGKVALNTNYTSEQETFRLQLLDIQGQNILNIEGKLNQINMSLNRTLGNLNQGLYFVKIINGANIFVERLVLQ